MTGELGWIVCLLLAVYGGMLLLAQLAARLLRPQCGRACWLLPLRGSCEDAEWAARAARRVARTGVRAYLVDDGIDPDRIAFVGAVCRRLQIPLISAEEIVNFALQDEENAV